MKTVFFFTLCHILVDEVSGDRCTTRAACCLSVVSRLSSLRRAVRFLGISVHAEHKGKRRKRGVHRHADVGGQTMSWLSTLLSEKAAVT